jgi:hypothetical protein
VVQLVEVLRYKPEDRRFDSRWWTGIFHLHNPSGLTMSLGSTQKWVPGIFSGEGRGCKGGRCIELTTLPPFCADCIEIWEPQPTGNLRICSRSVMELIYRYYIIAKRGYSYRNNWLGWDEHVEIITINFSDINTVGMLDNNASCPKYGSWSTWKEDQEVFRKVYSERKVTK